MQQSLAFYMKNIISFFEKSKQHYFLGIIKLLLSFLNTK